MLRQLLAAALSLLLAVPAYAGLPPASPQPLIIMDFASGTYKGCTLAQCVQVVRASTVATDLTWTSPTGTTYATFAANTPRITSGLGILSEDNRTNYLLLSTTPATQTTGIIPTGTFWLWVNGTGTATITAGTATLSVTGTASQGQPISGSVSVTGTVLVTVTGSLNQFQLEIGNSGPTSFIPTTVAPVARGTETVKAIGPLAALMSGASGFTIAAVENPASIFLERSTGNFDALGQVLNGNAMRAFANNTTATAAPRWTNTGVFIAPGVPGTVFSGASYTRNKFVTSWSKNGVSVGLNEGPIVSIGKQFNVAAPDTYIGSAAGTSSANFYIQSISAGNQPLSRANIRRATEAWTPVFIRYIGDSLTVGVQSTYPYPNQLMAMLPGGWPNFPGYNLGVGGIQASTIVTNWPSAIAPFKDRTINKCVDFIWAGTNDLANGNQTVPQIQTSLSTLWGLSASQGCSSIAATILPRNGGLSVSQATFEANRQTLNTWIRTQSASYYALMDVGNDPTIGQPGQYADTTYYDVDQTHLKATGDAIVAPYAYSSSVGILH